MGRCEMRSSIARLVLPVSLAAIACMQFLGGCVDFRYHSNLGLANPIRESHKVLVKVDVDGIHSAMRNEKNIEQIKTSIRMDLERNMFSDVDLGEEVTVIADVHVQQLDYSESLWWMLAFPLQYLGAPFGYAKSNASVQLTFYSSCEEILGQYSSTAEVKKAVGLYYGYGEGIGSRDGGVVSKAMKMAMEDIKEQVARDLTRLTAAIAAVAPRESLLARGAIDLFPESARDDGQESPQVISDAGYAETTADTPPSGVLVGSAGDRKMTVSSLLVGMEENAEGDQETLKKRPREKGSRRVSFGGSLTTSHGFSPGDGWVSANVNFEGRFSYGRFIKSGVELGASTFGGVTWSQVDGAPNNSVVSYGGADGYIKRYYVSASKTIPYIGGRAGAMGTLSDSGLSYSSGSATVGGTVGLEFMLSETASAFCEYNGIWGGGRSSGGNGGLGWNWTNQFLAGLSYYF